MSRSSKLAAGTLRRSTDSDPESIGEQSWCNAPGTTFETRVGPNYAYYRRKEASKPCLYECAAVDLYTTPSKISHVARFLDLPGDKLDDSVNQGYLPQTFIVNCQIPNYALENALWGTCAGDGPGYSLIFHFVLSEYGKEQVAKKGKLKSAADDPESEWYGALSAQSSEQNSPRSEASSRPSSRPSSASAHAAAGCSSAAPSSSSSSNSSSSYYYNKDDPSCFRNVAEPENASVRLLHNFVNAAEGSDLRQRFKGIARMMNVDSVGLGAASKKLVSMYNATPFLIRTCSVFWRGEGYFEVDVDVHRFSYTARLGLSGVRERIKDVVFDFGFVIEGHSDFELPENMLGAVRLSKLDLTQAKEFPA